jgi:trimethylamine:corrinoid methyltransferase-like protein
MQQELIPMPPAVALERVLTGLVEEIIEAADEELTQAAKDLGMDLNMRGSAAFLGVMYAMPKRIEDIFEPEDLRRAYAEFMRGHSPRIPGDEGEQGEK